MSPNETIKSSTRSKTRRELLREQHLKRARQQRIAVVASLIGVILIIAALIIIPQIQANSTPVGEFIRITPQAYPTANGTALGDPNAKAKIEVFEDFLCSACKSFTQYIEPEVIKQLVDTGQAYYVFHNYPFLDDRSAIKDSDNAANAALCAAEQGQFWNYKNLLYLNSAEVVGTFSFKILTAYAESLNLDTRQFKACLESSKYQAQIDQDIALAEKYNVTGTPSLFVNGKQVAPGYIPTFDQIQQAVQEAIAGN